MKSKKVLMVAITLILSAMLFAAGSSESQSVKSYVFGSDCTWPPFEYVDEKGDIVGFEIDLVAEIAKRAGVVITHKNVAWDGIFAGLTNGAYDGIASGVTVTAERKQSMDFSTPFLQVTQAIIVNKGSESLKNAASLVGKRIGVQLGTTGHIAMEKVAGVTIKAYDEIGLAVEDLLNKNVDAVVCDSIIAADFVLTNPNYQNKLIMSGTASEEVEDIALVVKKGNTALLKILNDGIAAVKADGTLAELKKKWNIL
jgi:polar amino acid transport system substrate-binding protein